MAHEGLNTIDPTVARRWVGEIERRVGDLLTERGIYMSRCKDIRDDIKDLKDRAVDAGVNRSALNGMLKVRDLERKIEAVVKSGDEEAEEQIELLRDALGEFANLPLGDAAVNAPAKRAAKKSEATMTLEQAHAILAKPRGRGRKSKEREAAEAIVAQASSQPTPLEEAVSAATGGASGAQAEVMADAMGGDALSSLASEDDRDLRPAFLRTAAE